MLRKSCLWAASNRLGFMTAGAVSHDTPTPGEGTRGPVGQAGAPKRMKMSSLPVDYFRSCQQELGVIFHSPLMIGMRSSQIRGLFLPMGHAVEPNTPVVTIPLASCLTNESVLRRKYANPDVTLAAVRDAIVIPEFRLMAPQLHLGLQVAWMAHSIPDIRAVSTQEHQDASDAILVDDIIPWVRILDDEDFNEAFVNETFVPAFDSWQKAAHTEMEEGFSRVIRELHYALKLPFPLRHLRRFCRLVLARTEHLPPSNYYDVGHRRRSMAKLWRSITRAKEPVVEGLTPVADLVNHSNRPNVGLRIGPSPALGGQAAVTIFTLMRLSGGQELCRHYNFALSRPAALFRYGFLPFDFISIVQHSSVNEHLTNGHQQMSPEAPEIVESRNVQTLEVERLEGLYRGAKAK